MSHSGEVGELTPRIELIYGADCPNAALARQRLRAALNDLGVASDWVEWERGSPEAPDYARRYGSPTILIDGSDVGHDGSAGVGEACRLYVGDGGEYAGAPSLDAIMIALRFAFRRRWSRVEAKND